MYVYREPVRALAHCGGPLRETKSLDALDVGRLADVLRRVDRARLQTSLINQSKVLTKPHTSKGEATSQHHHRGQQTLHHEVMQAWKAVNESRQH